MRTLSSCIISFLLCGINSPYGYGQTPQPDFYRTGSGRIRSAQEVEAVRGAYNHQRQQEAKFEQMRRPANTAEGTSASSILFRDRDKFIDGLLTPTASEISELRKANDKSKSGVFTFLGLNSCLHKITDEKQANLAGSECLDQTLPGLGRQFSFRTGRYSPLVHADLGVAGDWFFGNGLITQTILVDLGDIPMVDVNLERSDLHYITSFVPATSIEETSKQRVELENGISQNDRHFFNAVKAVAGHTYVLRSVAYRGELITRINHGDREIKLDSLKGDKREDVIVVFRVLDKAEKGNIRVLWRHLQTKESPKLDLPETKVDGSQVKTVIKVVN